MNHITDIVNFLTLRTKRCSRLIDLMERDPLDMFDGVLHYRRHDSSLMHHAIDVLLSKGPLQKWCQGWNCVIIRVALITLLIILIYKYYYFIIFLYLVKFISSLKFSNNNSSVSDIVEAMNYSWIHYNVDPF